MVSQINYKIQISNLTVGFNKKPVIVGLNLTLNGGERYCILGPSGHGKTTLLNAIAGNIVNIENAFFSGEILINDIPLIKRESNAINIGFVFQDLALFPNMTVFENVAFPLKIRKIKKEIIRERVKEILQILKIYEQENFKIEELSGGQKQRVALARTLVYEPEIILMDEPLKGLDHILKIQFIEKLVEIQEKLKFTLIYVTHDREDAFLIGNKIALLEFGKITQFGSPHDLYYDPTNIDSANYFGRFNTIQLIDEEPKSSNVHMQVNRNSIGPLNRYKNIKFNFIGFRPEQAVLTKLDSDTPVTVANNCIYFDGIVVSSIFLGSSYLIKLQINTSFILIKSETSMDLGSRTCVSVDFSKIVFFDENSNNINLS
jgi:ABC-type sugar transport system ATPase subunit